MGMNPFFREGPRGSRYTQPQPRQPYGGQNRNQYQAQSSLGEAIKKIQSLKNMSELDPKDFAGIEGIAAKVAQEISKDMKTSQLRKFFDPLVKIEDELKKESWTPEVEGRLYLVLPTLAYAVARHLAPKEFYSLIDECIKKVIVKEAPPDLKKANFQRFMEFLRAIVAYNKYFGDEYFGGD